MLRLGRTRVRPRCQDMEEGKVFYAERRERALEEAERALWMARAEYLREMMNR